MSTGYNPNRDKNGQFATGPKSPRDDRSFMDRLLGRHPHRSSVVADSNIPIPVPAAGAYNAYRTVTPTEPDYNDMNRFGFMNTGHAEINTLRHDIARLTQITEHVEYFEDGVMHTADMNFNPTHGVKDKIMRLAYKVLDESGKLDDNKQYRENRNVYSPETLDIADRLYNHGYNQDTFMNRAGETDNVIPWTVAHPFKTSTVYTYHVHADVSRLMDLVEADQKKHAGLQKNIAERRADVASLASRAAADPWADI